MDNEIFRRIDQQMKIQKKKHKELNAFLGLTHSTYDNWKRGTSQSFLRYIDRIAEFLNVTPNYLISGSDKVYLQENKRHQIESKVLEIMTSLPEREAERLLALIETFAATIEN